LDTNAAQALRVLTTMLQSAMYQRTMHGCGCTQPAATMQRQRTPVSSAQMLQELLNCCSCPDLAIVLPLTLCIPTITPINTRIKSMHQLQQHAAVLTVWPPVPVLPPGLYLADRDAQLLHEQLSAAFRLEAVPQAAHNAADRTKLCLTLGEARTS
jgi:hypothetical protein